MSEAAAIGNQGPFDPFDPLVIENPLPFYERLREESPALYLPKYDAWVISRFEDVFNVLLDPQGHFVAVEGTVVGVEVLEAHNTPGTIPEPQLEPLDKFSRLNNPEYSQVRHAFGGKSMRPRAALQLEPFVRQHARDAIESLRGRSSFNVVADYGGYVAPRVVCHLFDLDLSYAPELLAAVNAYTEKDPETGAFRPELQARVQEFALEAVQRRRSAGADGSVPTVDGLINFLYHGRPLTDEEIVAQLVIVMIGGTETVPKLVGHGLMELARHPDQRAAIGTDPARIATALEEILRYCAPAQWFLRTVTKPVTIAGQRLEVGQRVIPLNMSANLDTAEFGPDASAFVWNRPIRRHIAFGQGMKFCIGAHIARVESKVLLEEFLTAFPQFTVDETNLYRPGSSFQWGFMGIPVSPGLASTTETDK